MLFLDGHWLVIDDEGEEMCPHFVGCFHLIVEAVVSQTCVFSTLLLINLFIGPKLLFRYRAHYNLASLQLYFPPKEMLTGWALLCCRRSDSSSRKKALMK